MAFMQERANNKQQAIPRLEIDASVYHESLLILEIESAEREIFGFG